MKQIFNIILLLFIIFIDISLCVKRLRKQSVTSQEDALSWLNKYGYNPCLNSTVQCSLSLSSLLRDYQKRFHLKISGKLDDSTKEHMNRPRCGIPDKSIAEINAALISSKWSRSSLTYAIRGYPTQISETQTTNIIREAFQAWLDHVPLKIEPVCSTCQADFVLDFLREQHTDRYPFDGVGGTLAHAFFPEDGRIHFDKDEAWTESFNGYDTNLYLVAVHEIGHALGLDHKYDEKSIMYPSYQLMSKSKILPQTDRDDIQTLYGKTQPYGTPPTTRSTTTRSTTTTTTSTRKNYITTRSPVTSPSGKLHTRCRLFLDAAFSHPDGTFHTFNAGVLWRYLPNENTWENQPTIEKTYPKLPNKLRAGVYNSRKQEIIFFTDKYVYRYDVDNRDRIQYRSEQNLPRNLQNSIVGAIYYRSEIYIITSKTIRLFELGNRYQQSNDQALSEEFPRFTGTVETAFSYGNLHHFFTTKRRVFVWSERLNSWQTFDEPMETSWFACTSTNTYNPRFIPVEQPAETPRHRSPYGHRHHDHHRHRHRDHDHYN
ncbi:unnamed protein product [Rotaria sordida]|uniref:Peptidase metallopeptidase domain-containing protein n=1 Tax=Rotaria sordida TaxID=392033 RepID=A0A815HXS7_9BILA|nr:unnamed protein product [Rotaria sordida]